MKMDFSFAENILGVRLSSLPISIIVLIETVLRNSENVDQNVLKPFVEWLESGVSQSAIEFKPARVLMQDFTGVPAVVDLAAMRDALQGMGGDPDTINPLCPVDLVIDHSVNVISTVIKMP